MTNDSGFVYLAAQGAPTKMVAVESADRASAVFARYRDQYALGASDLHERCGNIYASDGTLVARVSYNGRVWSPQGQLLQEPEPGVATPPGRPGDHHGPWGMMPTEDR